MKYEQRTPQLRLKLEGWRSRFVLVLIAAGFALLAGRAFYLQGMDTGFLQAKGEARYARVVEMPASRGPVKDRNGKPLAISTPVESIWVSPEDVEADAAQLRSLGGAISAAATFAALNELFFRVPALGRYLQLVSALLLALILLFYPGGLAALPATVRRLRALVRSPAVEPADQNDLFSPSA